ncbi:MAG: tetratricopeptide repeat protein, partial [Candidatus Omnitrophica bacterium]|nr:tetratricopeptide repeat protein [Candidatus Omnitrophota bacterium]
MNRLRITFLTLFVCAAINGFSYTVQDAEEDLRDHQFGRVLDQLRPESFSDEEDQAYGVYLLGAAAFHLNEYERALELFESLMQKHPQSRWFVKAAYRKAECLMLLKKYDEAEIIYAAGIEGLLTQERRCSLAGVYIGHADRFYAPQEKNKPPQYDQARTLYQRALEILPKGILWERATYQIAMSYFKQERWKEAQTQFQTLRKFYENPPETICSIVGDATSETMPNPYPHRGYLDDALLREGEALYEMGNTVEARRIWKKLRDARRKETRRPEVVAEAAYRVGKTYGMPKPGHEKDLSLGVKNLEEYISLFPDHAKVPQAAFDIAQAYFHRSQYDKAITAYREGIERYGNKADPQMIAAAEFSIAQCLAKLEKYDEAIQAYKTFLANHPVDENWSRAQMEIVSTQYQQVESIQREAEKERARWINMLRQEKKDPDKASISQTVLDRFKQARTAWESYLKQHPLDSRVAFIQLLLGKNERSLRRIEEAAGIWMDLAGRFPQADEASEAKFLIAEIAEKEQDDPEKAIDLYKEVSFGPFQGPALERIRLLQEISLALRTDQIFRTDQTPKVHVSVRNIEQLTCKLHPLDLQTYFQSKHVIRNVEDLDVNLIAPDKIWDVTPENYRPCHLLSQDIEIPVEGPGAWVVQVKSETLEAVTLLIVSDLAIAMKGGKQEIFVYAENQRTEEVVPETEIFVSDGGAIVAQGKTNRDGIYHVQNLEAMECYDISIFASYQGHWAGEKLFIQNTQTASPLQPRVLIYSDRSGYQPGERVHYRAMIREIENGRYVVPKDAEYQITALDSRGATIYQESAVLSKFGTLHGEFDLDKAAPMGQYRIMASCKEGPSGSWAFDVQEFTLPAAQIVVETGQKTYFYGDEITGSIQLMDFSGNPLPDEPMRYALTDPGESDILEGRTDKDGKISFRFETWDLPEEGRFAIHALATERQIMGEAAVVLVNTGFTISLETTRATYLAGEPFQVQAAARRRDEKGERIETTLKILLQKRNYEGAYETIDTKTVVTSPDEKKTAYASFAAKSGGDYRIRAEGSDQRGTTVAVQKHLKISGDDDANQLLILSDRSFYQQGDTASFTVVSRLPENLCLITGEREGIVEYRIETLHQGKNTITWKLDERYNPTAVISLVVMHGGQLHHRDVQFEVHRGLDVTITADSKKYAPRDEAEIRIETRDHNGRPVMAEFSLGLVDSALLALFPDRTPEPASYFDQAVRGRFLATNSSVGFRYEGETRVIEEEYLRIVAGKEVDFLSDKEIGEGLRRGGAIYKAEEAAKGIREVRKARYSELAPAEEPEAPVA